MDESIFRDSLRLLNDNNVRFAVIKLISCNGTESVTFPDARCGFEVLKDENKIPCFVPFTVIFEKGISFLRKIKNTSCEEIEKQQGPTKDAVLCLDRFYKSKEQNEASLKKVFDMGQDGKPPTTETDVTICLAEHLLGRLAPKESYQLNSMSKGNICRCGCQKELTFSFTGIGHELVWHGFMDIIFLSHQGIPAIANTVIEREENTPKKRKLDEMDDRLDEDDYRQTTINFKQKSPNDTLAEAFAQTIVFSLTEKQKHPNFFHHMVPNIVISPEKFEIVLYDADRDTLLCSNSIFLFNLDLPEHRSLTNDAVLILWMVLHYELFCSGFDKASDDLLDTCKSNFKNLVQSKWDIYSTSLKCCVSGFPPVKHWSVNELLRRGHQLNLN
ncbi:uncharacterized protein LOC133199005 [Saccostrea echinata]|uniref:uncharacterized protein LOC133199005 n=1 Tax=Saccostrea echinata TaxID=191078 RepID=UPI002A7FAB02|nr:uncharacterized protein LOC133199005 [Saccostrea echinata]